MRELSTTSRNGPISPMSLFPHQHSQMPHSTRMHSSQLWLQIYFTTLTSKQLSEVTLFDVHSSPESQEWAETIKWYYMGWTKKKSPVMTSQRAENLVYVQRHRGKYSWDPLHYIPKIIFQNQSVFMITKRQWIIFYSNHWGRLYENKSSHFLTVHFLTVHPVVRKFGLLLGSSSSSKVSHTSGETV